jgi:hypothetical protein
MKQRRERTMYVLAWVLLAVTGIVYVYALIQQGRERQEIKGLYNQQLRSAIVDMWHEERVIVDYRGEPQLAVVKR